MLLQINFLLGDNNQTVYILIKEKLLNPVVPIELELTI